METIKTWQERNGDSPSVGPFGQFEKAMCAEIADLRAALAKQAEAAPVGAAEDALARLHATLLVTIKSSVCCTADFAEKMATKISESLSVSYITMVERTPEYPFPDYGFNISQRAGSEAKPVGEVGAHRSQICSDIEWYNGCALPMGAKLYAAPQPNRSFYRALIRRGMGPENMGVLVKFETEAEKTQDQLIKNNALVGKPVLTNYGVDFSVDAPQPDSRRDAALEPVVGDVLPPVGSDVLIRHGRDDDEHICTVTGYYAWPDLGGNKSLHRVFVRLVYKGTNTEQSRLLCDITAMIAQQGEKGGA